MMNEQLQGLKQALLEEERVNDYQWAYRVPGTYNKYNYKKLVNMDIEELKKVYKFCNEMLYNGDRKHQGRTVVRDKIIGVIDKLNAEYMIREDMVKSGMSKQQILDIIRTQKRSNKAVFGDIVSADYKYAKIPLKIIANACKNHLGLFDSGIVSYTFVTKLGVKHDDYFAEKYKKFVEKEGACSPSDYIHKYLNVLQAKQA